MTHLPSASMPARALAIATLALAASLAALPTAAATADACAARSGPTVPTVVELYTSEGCSSCPPAERWLGALNGHEGIVTLAFHVDYWDYLGWKDRFAQPLFTQRQNASQHTSGARFAYTPQVILDSRDLPAWSTLAPAALQPRTPATVGLALARDGDGLALTVTPGPGAPAALSGYVAVVDDGLRTQVGAGENRGATLRQDAVVRELLPWSLAGHQAATLRFAPHAAPEAGAARHWMAVATDGPYGKPVQALTLACAR